MPHVSRCPFPPNSFTMAIIMQSKVRCIYNLYRQNLACEASINYYTIMGIVMQNKLCSLVRPECLAPQDYCCILHNMATHAFNRPAVAFESDVRLMKKPKSRDTAVSILTELILTVNGFWFFLKRKMIGKHVVSDPSSVE